MILRWDVAHFVFVVPVCNPSFRALAILLFLLVPIPKLVGQETTIFYHSLMDGEVPEQWTAENNVEIRPIPMTTSNGFFLLEARAGLEKDYLISPILDLSSYQNLELGFSIASYGNGVFNACRIEISYDGGVNFTESLVSILPTGANYIHSGPHAILGPDRSAVVLRLSNNGSSLRDVRLRNIFLEGVYQESSVGVATSGAYRTNILFTGNVSFNNNDPVAGIVPWEILEETSEGLIWTTASFPPSYYDTINQVELLSGDSIFLNTPLKTGTLKLDHSLSVFLSNTGHDGLEILANGRLEIIRGTFVNWGALLLNEDVYFVVNEHAKVELHANILEISPSTVWEVRDSASVIVHDFQVHLFAGTERFFPQSHISFLNWDDGESLFEHPSTVSSFFDSLSGEEAKFGHLSIFADTGGAWDVVFPSGQYQLTHGNLKVSLANSSHVTLFEEGSEVVIGGDLTTDGSVSSTLILVANAGVNLPSEIAVQGSFLLHGGVSFLAYESAGEGDFTFSILEDFRVLDGKFVQGNFTFSAAKNRLFIGGDVMKSPGASWVGSADGGWAEVHISGNNTHQYLDIARNVSDDTDGDYVHLFIDSTAFAQLVHQNFYLGSGGSVVVAGGASFHFAWDEEGEALYVASREGAEETGFQVEPNGTLILTSLDVLGALCTSGQTGNVRTDLRIFDGSSNYHFKGQGDQISGDGLPPIASDKWVIIDLPDTNVRFILTQTVRFSNSSNASRGLEIRQGKVVDHGSAFFADGLGAGQRGNLTMRGGLYQFTGNVSSPNSAVFYPRLSGVFDLTGGVIDLAANQTSGQYQRLRGGKDYYVIRVSGTSSGGGYKDVTSNSRIHHQLVIQDAAVFNVRTTGISGDGGVRMTGGRLRIAKRSFVQPELQGISTPYNLLGGTVEFYGTNADQNIQVRESYGLENNPIHYHHIDVYSNETNLESGNVRFGSVFVDGVLRVHPRANLTILDGAAIKGVGSFYLEEDAWLQFSDPLGVSSVAGEGCLQLPELYFDPLANIALVSAADIVTGDRFPGLLSNLLCRSSVNAQFILRSDLLVRDTLFLLSGAIRTADYHLYLGSVNSEGGVLQQANGTVLGRLWRHVNLSGNAPSMYLFPLSIEQDSEFNWRFFYVNHSGSQSFSGYLGVEYKEEAMGVNGLPILLEDTGGADFDVSVNSDGGYWKLYYDEEMVLEQTFDVRVVVRGMSEVVDIDRITVLMRSPDCVWTSPGHHSAATGAFGNFELGRHAVSIRGDFGLGGDAGFPLLMKDLSLSSGCFGLIKEVSWDLQGTGSLVGLELERSSDLLDWKSIYASDPWEGGALYLDSSVSVAPVYYRLKGRYLDDKVIYSDPVSLHCGPELVDLSIFPNPSFSTVQVLYESHLTDDFISIELLDEQGRLVFFEESTLAKGSNMWSLALGHLEKGVYVVRLRGKASVYAQSNLVLI